MSNERLTARVKWFNPRAGYGFLTDCKNADDVFVHHTEITTSGNVYKTLTAGEYVEYVTTTLVKFLQQMSLVFLKVLFFVKDQDLRKKQKILKEKKKVSLQLNLVPKPLLKLKPRLLNKFFIFI